MNRHHQDILDRIQKQSGTPTQHTFLDRYLGNENPRYPISVPVLRQIGRDWMKNHTSITSSQFASLLSSMVKGCSSTEKCMVGILLDYTTPEQRKFDPVLFGSWLDHLKGWAEIDSVCTGRYPEDVVPAQWSTWKSLITEFSKSQNINKRRASLVLFCSPLQHAYDRRLVQTSLSVIDRLKHEKEILITKAISWVLRTAIKHSRDEVERYLDENRGTLPAIAVRETMTKLITGTKNQKAKQRSRR